MTSQAQQRAAAAYAEKYPLALCDYEIVPEDGARPVTQEIDLEARVAKIFGLGQSRDAAADTLVRTAVKTWAFTGKLWTAAHEPIGTLDNLTITALRLNDPLTGRPLVTVTLDYLATSHGWRTGRGAFGEPYGMNNTLIFKNSAGGVVWTMQLGAFMLQCDWNRWHVTHGGGDRYNVAWFDVCEGVTHEVRGTVFRC